MRSLSALSLRHNDPARNSTTGWRTGYDSATKVIEDIAKGFGGAQRSPIPRTKQVGLDNQLIQQLYDKLARFEDETEAILHGSRGSRIAIIQAIHREQNQRARKVLEWPDKPFRHVIISDDLARKVGLGELPRLKADTLQRRRAHNGGPSVPRSRRITDQNTLGRLHFWFKCNTYIGP